MMKVSKISGKSFTHTSTSSCGFSQIKYPPANIFKGVGLSFLLIQINDRNCLRYDEDCLVRRNKEGKLVANCSIGWLQRSYYPEDDIFDSRVVQLSRLDEYVEIIDLSGIPASSLPNLRHYPYITEVHLRDMTGTPSEDFFDSVPNLRVLDISYSTFTFRPKLPSSITNLTARSLVSRRPSLVNLYNLKHLNLKDNNLENFPAIPDIAPIVYLDLSENDNLRVTLMNIAPYCHLKNIDLYRTSLEDDSCCEIETWLHNHKISYHLTCRNRDRNGFLGELSYGGMERCSNAPLFEEADEKYNECLTRAGGSFFVSNLLLVLLGLIIISVIVALVYNGYQWNSKQTSNQKSKPKNEPQPTIKS